MDDDEGGSGMELAILLLVLVGGGLLVQRWIASRRPAPPEDDWVLPPAGAAPTLESGRRPGAAGPSPAQQGERTGPREVLDRDALAGRGRDFDPTGWDDSPDSQSGTDVEPPGRPA